MSEEERQSFVNEHRLIVMVAASAVLALGLVIVAMALYYTSGAAQLDLSRPGLSEIREKVSDQEDFEGFSASGEVNSEELTAFEKMYDKKLKEIQSVDAFSADVLSPETLQINDTSDAQ